MVVSGNDACNVIAEHVAGSVTDFVRMMNQRAYELGCTNTHFNNPHGLHDESHYTTARDLSIITQAALKSENFRQIVDTYEYQLPDDNMRQNIPKLKTTNMLIYRSLSNTLYYPRAHGIKTGYTSQAGRCVISEATGDGLDLLGIVCGAATTILDSGDLLMENFTECASLFDYGFDNYSYLTLMSPLYPVDQVKINNSAGAEAVAVAPQDEIKGSRPTMTLIRWSRISSSTAKASTRPSARAMCSARSRSAMPGRSLDRRSCLPSPMWRARNFRPPQPGRRHISRKTGGSGS